MEFVRKVLVPYSNSFGGHFQEDPFEDRQFVYDLTQLANKLVSSIDTPSGKDISMRWWGDDLVSFTALVQGEIMYEDEEFICNIPVPFNLLPRGHSLEDFLDIWHYYFLLWR